MRNTVLLSLVLLGCGDSPPPEEPPPPAAEPRLDALSHPDGEEVTQGGRVRITAVGEHLELAWPAIDGATLSSIEGTTYTFTIDPGSALGPRALRLDDLVVEDAITVVATVVDPANGNDDGTGTPADPLRTLARAVDLQRAPGSQISLVAGNHVVDDGFGVGGGVVITGAGPAATTISVPSCGTYFTCIALHGTLSQVRVVSTVARPLSVGEHGALTDAEILGGGDGVHLQKWARLERVTVSAVSRGIVALPVDITIKDCRISDNSQSGLSVYTDAAGGRITVEGTTFERNDQGLVTIPNHLVSLVVRGSTFAENRVGLRMTYTNSDVAVDLGSSLSPGANVFRQNEVHISDERGPRTAADGLVATFVGSSFDAADPEGMVVGVDTDLPLYEITHANNRIAF